MPAKILSGIDARNARLIQLKGRLSRLAAIPEMAIIQVGDRADSTAYINAKISFARELGVPVRFIDLPDTVSTEAVIERIRGYNADPAIKGIVVQLPLPSHIDRDAAIAAIDPRKDIDGLTPANASLLEKGDRRAIVPATARGIVELLSHYGIEVQDKKVAVVGRSMLVGAPIAKLLSNKGARVTVAHSKTIDLKKEAREADIVIAAVGKARLITSDHAREGQIIVDVGINAVDADERMGRRKLVGDVDFSAVSQAIGPTGAISPVPGGVGPMTVLGLFENLIDAASADMVK